MTTLLWTILWVVSLAVGVPTVRWTRPAERRYAAVAALGIAVGAALGAGFSAGWGERAVLGPFGVDSVAVTVAPAMFLGAIGLLLSAGRAEAAGDEPAWLLGILLFSSLAMLSHDLYVLCVFEAASIAVLAAHARARGDRAHMGYLLLALAVLGSGAGLWATGQTQVGALLLGIGALARLGVFPLSTGLLSALRRGPSTAALIGTLPLGGVLLLLRVRAAMDPMTLDVIGTVLLVSAPLAAALAVSQDGLGRSFGYMLAALGALIGVAALDVSPDAAVGSQLLWAATVLTASGFGAVSNLVVLRLGAPDLSRHHGLHRSAQFLSLAFLVLGVGLAGAPGTLEFVADDVLLNTARIQGLVGVALVVSTLALIGFNVLRMHFRVFFGAQLRERPSLRVKARERVGLLVVGGAVVLGGLVPGVLPLLSGR